MICVQNVVKHFSGINAVENVTLSVARGEIFGLVGPDGAGKSTMIRMLTGILRPDLGRISILGHTEVKHIKEKIGYVPQKFSLYGDLTVIENIRVMGALYGAKRDVIEKQGTELLAFTKLLPYKDRLADHLSGGMKQKLSLAAALMHKPQLFFLDEPTTGVDPVSRREFWQTLYHLNKEGMTIFVSTPYMDEAELCTKIAFMHNGRIVCTGTPGKLKADYPYDVLELVAAAKNMKNLFTENVFIDINTFGDKYHLVVSDVEQATAFVKKQLAASGIAIHVLQKIEPTLEDVFVHLASEVS